jgi:HAD superfamily hydrolase (TIGR01484 family)
MKTFNEITKTVRKNIQYVLTDIDDTLTHDGKLPAVAYEAMERLHNARIPVIPITGRPAGWCDHFARMWPIAAIVGENGAFYFRYDPISKKMIRRYWKSDSEREQDQKKLNQIKDDILTKVPGCAVSADQAYREADLAIDFCEDVPPLQKAEIDKIVDCFTNRGATAKISSIHVNGWYGDYDKLSMTRILFEEVFKSNLDSINEHVIFTGDSPNDAPMFAFFKNGTGVANVTTFTEEMAHLPTWILSQKGGFGFAEMVHKLLEK